MTSLAQACHAGMRATDSLVRAASPPSCWPRIQSADGAVLADGGRAAGGERGERRMGARADAALGQPQQLGQLRVVATLAQQQLEDGALVGCEAGERAHRQARG